MPEFLIGDVENQVHVAEVTEFQLLTTGMENAVGNSINLAWLVAHYRNQVVVLGSINGVNTTFTLPDSDNAVATEQLWYGGSNLIPNVDYTITGNTITMLWIPTTASTFVATYFYGLT